MLLRSSLARSVKLLVAIGAVTVAAVVAIPMQAQAATAASDISGRNAVSAEPAPAGAHSMIMTKTASVSARKLCSGHPEEYGNWVNADPDASGIARIELRDCLPVTVCNGDICSITHDAGWSTHVFGKCTPTNCDWGWSKADFRLSSGQVYGFYDQGFAKRYVYAKMSAYRPGQLWVHWRTDFVDPARADYERDEWFVRA